MKKWKRSNYRNQMIYFKPCEFSCGVFNEIKNTCPFFGCVQTGSVLLL